MLESPLMLRVEIRGGRLDQFLAGQIPTLSRARIQALLKSGHITLNGQPARPASKLTAGDEICVVEPPPVPADVSAEDIPLAVLFEDDDLIVIDKPAGLVVHPAVGNRAGTLVNALLHHCRELSGIGGVERPGIVHRLDKETSGCLVAAKNDIAHRSLVEQFAGREVSKTYLALASGRFRWKSGDINEPIGRHRANRQKMDVTERGKPAHTGWRVLLELDCGTLVACTLHTGRTHQIRVHLQHLGHPVLGDETYGKRAGFTRQMLHAWRLGFTHPRTGAQMNFQSPIPPDFIKAGVPATLP
ncbi:MAG: RluA family pseudouridine synthase [Chthoniobacteraceae bacterium]